MEHISGREPLPKEPIISLPPAVRRVAGSSTFVGALVLAGSVGAAPSAAADGGPPTSSTAQSHGYGPPDGGAVDPVVEPVAAAQGEGRVSALTFDDGPNPSTTGDLLDYLDEQDISAVFCVIGQNIRAPGGAELLRRIVDGGHVLCNHSTGYADMGDWSPERVRADLAENLRIIRQALGDPTAEVPYFRAPNGSWGATREVAVELGMQPLAVTGVIFDWETQDVDVLTANLRAAMVPGELVLAHDGGGERDGTLQAVRTVVSERQEAGWEFALPEGVPADGQVGPGFGSPPTGAADRPR